MILLGSIERVQLQSLLAQQLGRPRRLEFIKERSLAEKKRLSVVSDPGSENDSQRISQEVRFQVRGHGQCSEVTRGRRKATFASVQSLYVGSAKNKNIGWEGGQMMELFPAG